MELVIFMKTISNKIIHEIEIQKSRFICYIDVVHSKEEVECILESVKENYPNATHYCYAYIIDTVKRFQDDGEPSGTAGMPMLHVLESQDLQHILAIVIRYFGGIKLGAGGLVRAYSNSVSETLQLGTISKLYECHVVSFVFGYANLKQVDYILQGFHILQKDFHDKIQYDVAVVKDTLEELISALYKNIESYSVSEKTIFMNL